LNALGEVIGVTTQTQSRSGNSNGVGFVIPSNTVRKVALQLAAGHAAKHAFFGASFADSTSPVGARLVIVPNGSPSARAGLKKGDVLTSIDGALIDSWEQVRALTA